MGNNKSTPSGGIDRRNTKKEKHGTPTPKNLKPPPPVQRTLPYNDLEFKEEKEGNRKRSSIKTLLLINFYKCMVDDWH